MNKDKGEVKVERLEISHHKEYKMYSRAKKHLQAERKTKLGITNNL